MVNYRDMSSSRYPDRQRVPGLCAAEERVPGGEPGQRLRPAGQDPRVGPRGSAALPEGRHTRQETLHKGGI